MNLRNLKIVSDGTGRPGGTYVIDVETGERLKNITEVSFRHRVGEIPTARIEVILSAIEVITQARVEPHDFAGLDLPYRFLADDVRGYTFRANTSQIVTPLKFSLG